MSHREFVRYVERLKRDMDVLRSAHDVVSLTNKIERLEAELKGQDELYWNLVKTRNAITTWIDDCEEIPLVPRHDLWATLHRIEFDPSTKDPHRLAMELQDLALEVTRHTEDRNSPEVQLIFKSLLELATMVTHLE